ncbi:hypothetical protein [Photobacterium kishitanii]|nr:hypothetical protein [Photobacterium kishitanii]
MKKTFLISILALASTSAHAFDPKKISTQWQVNLSNVAIAADSKMLAFVNVEPQNNFIYVTDLEEKCSQGEKVNDLIWAVNGKSVWFRGNCFQGHPLMITKSKKGADFVFNEFLTKDSVKISNKVFTTDGFESAFKRIKAIQSDAL